MQNVTSNKIGAPTRRTFLNGAITAASLALLTKTSRTSGATSSQPETSFPLTRFPEKTEMILLTDRPPQLETPIKYFQSDLTPNDAFFVRWHLSGIPTSVNTRTFKLSIAGHVEKPLDLSLEQLQKDFDPVSLVAVA